MHETIKGVYRAFLLYGDRIIIEDHRFYHYENKVEFSILMFDSGRHNPHENDHTRHDFVLTPEETTHKSYFVEMELWAHT